MSSEDDAGRSNKKADRPAARIRGPGVIAQIRARQANLEAPPDLLPPAHQPEMLFIGCIDARLNITSDIGIPYGAALVYRNIAALVAGTHGDDDPTHVGEAATLEFAINVMGVTDIVVMGHTDCGGIRACLHGAPGMHHVMQYLAPLSDVRSEVRARGGDVAMLARRMELAAVRQSVANLKSYRAVADAVASGRLSLHGWVINTATKRIFEMDHATGAFHLMS